MQGGGRRALARCLIDESPSYAAISARAARNRFSSLCLIKRRPVCGVFTRVRVAQQIHYSEACCRSACPLLRTANNKSARKHHYYSRIKRLRGKSRIKKNALYLYVYRVEKIDSSFDLAHATSKQARYLACSLAAREKKTSFLIGGREIKQVGALLVFTQRVGNVFYYYGATVFVCSGASYRISANELCHHMPRARISTYKVCITNYVYEKKNVERLGCCA